MLQGIIFDMDGTITLTEPLHHQAFAAVFREYGIEFPYEDEIRRFAGGGSKNVFSTIFSEHRKKLSAEEIEQCIAKKKSLYTKIVQETEIPFVKGVHEFVRRIHERGLKKIIATGNSNLEAVRFILEKVKLLEFFPEIVSVVEVAHAKPFPDVFLEAARRMHVECQYALVLEDAINGVNAAKAAGIRCIAFETTTSRADLIKAGAASVLKDYTEITDELLFFQ